MVQCIMVSGLFLSQELYIRLCLRHVFIDRCHSKVDKAFWIDLILKPHSPDQQARILFLLFGMMYGGTCLFCHFISLYVLID